MNQTASGGDITINGSILSENGTVTQTAAGDLTVTGKEVCAEAIHKLSKQKNGAFVPINCAAIPRDLMIKGLLKIPLYIPTAASSSVSTTEIGRAHV